MESHLEEYIGYATIETCISVTVLTTVFISLRLYSKFGIMQLNWEAEDTLLATGYFFHEALCTVGIRKSHPWSAFLLTRSYGYKEIIDVKCVGVADHLAVLVQYAGVGHHVEWVELNNPALLTWWAKLILATELLHFTAVSLPRMAIITFYLRIFQWKGWMLETCKALMLLLVAVWFAMCGTRLKEFLFPLLHTFSSSSRTFLLIWTASTFTLQREVQ